MTSVVAIFDLKSRGRLERVKSPISRVVKGKVCVLGGKITAPFAACCDSCLKSTTTRELPDNSRTTSQEPIFNQIFFVY